MPQVCASGNIGVADGSDWVVCAADASSAWLSHGPADGGTYNADLICLSLGYAAVGSYGGTCGDSCGYCDGGTSCSTPGIQTFDGPWPGTDTTSLGWTVTWECTN